MEKLFFAVFKALTFFARKESPNTITLLNGNDWELKEYNSPASDNNFNWQPATVPGSVQTDLLKLGNILSKTGVP